MRFIKLAFISILILGFIVTAISLLLPSHVVVTRAINIHAPTDEVYDHVGNLSNWKSWMEFNDSSNTAGSTPLQGKGATIKMGNTDVTIANTSTDQIQTTWRMKARRMNGDFNFIDRKDSAVVTVEWVFSQDVKWYPWEKFGTILMEKTLGPFMEKSLENLKSEMEKP